MRRAASAAAYLLLVLAAGAATASNAVTGSGAPRIVSLSPHITELLFAAGAGARLVGADDASDYPPEVARLPRVGEAAHVDLEALLRLRPTLVILWDSGTPPRVRAELERVGLNVLATEQRSLDDIGDVLVQFGALAGTAPAAAEAARRYRGGLAQLRERYAARARLTAFFQVWDKPLYTVSGKHVISEALSLCGADNVFAELSTLAPLVDREAVLARHPDVILIGAAGSEGQRQAADWERFPSLPAVLNHHIFAVNSSLVSRMAPRILDGVEEMCSALDQARGMAGGPARGVSIKRQSPDDTVGR